MNDALNIKQRIGEDATALQDAASNPTHNIWVGASAGTGKTKVLTDRVLRLLLPMDGVNDGTDPSKILCITFTKAGASEMIARVMKILSHWATCEESTLDKKLTNLLGHAPSLKQRDKARRLFAQVVDMPEGIKITTIHAFCQSILGRFPLEAGLPPHFTLIEESEAMSLIQKARNNLITDIQGQKTSKDIADAFYAIATMKNGEQINRLIQTILYDREKIKRHGRAMDDVYAYLGITPQDEPDDILKEFFSTQFPEEKIHQLMIALSHGATKNKEKSDALKSFLNLSLAQKIQNFDRYASAFLAKNNKFFAESHVSKGARTYDENAPFIFHDEAVRVKDAIDTIQSIALARSTRILLTLADEIIHRYDDLKHQQNFLDYDDLITITRDLLYARTDKGIGMSDWVLYKIDGGIDHILVDEAQDTNPLQWDIILKLCEDFFSGVGVRDDDDNDRTLFIVGDEKQSIYRFQGADPLAFSNVKETIQNRILNAQKPWQDVPMNTSFRSVSAILNMVDAVFDQDDLKGRITQNVRHTAYRYGESGRVDIWPLYSPPETVARAPWQMPTEICGALDSKAALADRIAAQIQKWLAEKTHLVSQNRPITASDIMILVRRRNVFVDHLIRSLKLRNIPVSGVDRMVITDQIAVQDILAALHFGLMPDDDLNLACLLKSPFVNFDDQQLEEYAYARASSLWEAIKEKAPSHIITWLQKIIENCASLSCFEMINRLLISPTPHQQYSGWKAILSRLGYEAVDAIEEFISQAQNYDFKNPQSGIQGFLHHMQSDTRTIKREMDTSSGLVRIMTVHASKGLQAPIVFLPDTCALPRPSGQSDGGFIWVNGQTPLWIPSSDDANDAYNHVKEEIMTADMDEYYRLLYVAMTRAEDRLIVCGYLPQTTKNPPSGCWYDVIENALPSLSFVKNPWDHDAPYVPNDAHSFTFETEQAEEAKSHDLDHDPVAEIPDLPAWVSRIAQSEQHPPKTFMPSKMDDEDVPVRSPLRMEDDSYRFQRGLITHSLLQYLPDISDDKRADAAQSFIHNQAPDLPPETKHSITQECLKILNSDQFSPFFGAGSLAEVPITGMIVNQETGKKDIISGQIDRMVVGKNDIWIIDYKSNRPPPTDVKKIPRQYINQMRAYRQLIADIYPNHTIHTALLWTDGPFMMEIEG